MSPAASPEVAQSWPIKSQCSIEPSPLSARTVPGPSWPASAVTRMMSGTSASSISPSLSSSFSEATIGIIITLRDPGFTVQLARFHSTTGLKVPTFASFLHSGSKSPTKPGGGVIAAEATARGRARVRPALAVGRRAPLRLARSHRRRRRRRPLGLAASAGRRLRRGAARLRRRREPCGRRHRPAAAAVIAVTSDHEARSRERRREEAGDPSAGVHGEPSLKTTRSSTERAHLMREFVRHRRAARTLVRG
jgi:hypothetical protein